VGLTFPRPNSFDTTSSQTTLTIDFGGSPALTENFLSVRNSKRFKVDEVILLVIMIVIINVT